MNPLTVHSVDKPCVNPLTVHSIDKRRREVLEQRQKAKDKAGNRQEKLGGSLAFQEFKRDSSEVRPRPLELSPPPLPATVFSQAPYRHGGLVAKASAS